MSKKVSKYVIDNFVPELFCEDCIAVLIADLMRF